MIILDPDLDPDPRPSINLGPHSPESRKAELTTRLPSTRTLSAFLREAQTAVRLKGAVSVLLTTDPAIRKLNRDFRHKNKATDVLSFPADPIPGLRRSDQPAGDLAISIDTARKQADGQGHTLSTEIKVLILHGLLHLAGYDHETDTGQMARRERTLRAQLNLPLGLIERTQTANPPKNSRAPSSRLISGARVGEHEATPARSAVGRTAGALKGHGFSRAESSPKKSRALATEGHSPRPASPSRKVDDPNPPRMARSAVGPTAGGAR